MTYAGGRAVWALALVFLIASELPAFPESPLGGSGSDPGSGTVVESTNVAFRLRIEILVSGGRRETRVCVAGWIDGRWALTAAHCLPDRSEALTVSCQSEAEPAGRQNIRIVRIVHHPTHDVALIETTGSTRCEAGTLAIADRITPGASFHALLLPCGPIAEQRSSATRVELVEVTRDAHVLRLLTESDCPQVSDSGTPVLVSGQADGPEAAGILIAGAPGCPGIQTVLRLDLLTPWIRRQTKEAFDASPD